MSEAAGRAVPLVAYTYYCPMVAGRGDEQPGPGLLVRKKNIVSHYDNNCTEMI